MGEIRSDEQEELSHPEWFREPSQREHWIGAGLFVGSGCFFLVLFWAYRGWWFRWVMLGLGIMSIWRGLGHVRRALGWKKEDPPSHTNEHEG